MAIEVPRAEVFFNTVKTVTITDDNIIKIGQTVINRRTGFISVKKLVSGSKFGSQGYKLTLLIAQWVDMEALETKNQASYAF